MSIKKKIGRFIPYQLIEYGRRIIFFGPDRCDLCGAHIRTRLDSGYKFPVLESLQVVGGMTRKHDLCPVCHSGSRERLIWFYLTQHYFTASKAPDGLRVAHFAPEKGLSKRLQNKYPATYNAYDFSPNRYRHLKSVSFQDLENLSLEDNSVDLLLCNHVMEHVYNLPQALKEVHRVLRPSGLAIMQVPISLNLKTPREGGQDLGPAERIELFGQDDHVRLFNKEGYIAALNEAGFAVDVYEPFSDDAPAATIAELDPLEQLLLITIASPNS